MDLLPGYILSPFSIENFEQAEMEFSRKHLAVTHAAAETATDRIAEMMLRIANNDVANRRFAFDTPGYRACAFSNTSLPFMLWLSLQARHPKITLAEATALIKDENEGKLRMGIFELQGYKKPAEKEEVDPKKPLPETESSSSEPSTPT